MTVAAAVVVLLSASPAREAWGGTRSAAETAAPPGGVNVLDHGADATGTHDSSTAINAALAAGDTAYLPCGTYLVVAPISLASGKALRGAGRCTVIAIPGTGFVGERVVTNADPANGNARIAISDLALRVDAETPVDGASPGIVRFEKVDGLTIERVYSDATFSTAYVAIDLAGGVRHATVAGCDLRNAFDGESVNAGALWIRGGSSRDAALDSSDIRIEDNYLQGAGDEAAGLYGWFNTIRRVTFTGNVIVRGGVRGGLAFAVSGHDVAGQGGAVEDVAVTGNVIFGRTNVITGASRVVLADNLIVGPTFAGDDAVTIAAYAAGQAPPADVVVEGNAIHGAARGGIYSEAVGSTIRGNAIHSVAGSAIRVGGGLVEGNEIDGAGDEGIHAEGPTVVRDNRIVGTPHGVVAYCGARDALAGTVIEGNEIENAAEVGILVNAWDHPTKDVAVRRNVVSLSGAASAASAYDVGGSFSDSEFSENRALVRPGGSGSFAATWTVSTAGVRSWGNSSGP